MLDARMVGWLAGWVDVGRRGGHGCVQGSMDGGREGCVNRLVDGLMGGLIDRSTDGSMDGWAGGCRDRRQRLSFKRYM